MAHISDGESLSISFPITKATEAEDGSIYVEGLCTDDGIDLDDQIIDAEFAQKGLADWFTTYANVRQMHSSNLAPAGKAVDMEKRAEGIWIRTRVVEPTAVKLVKEGVYQAYSVGISKPRIIRDGIAKNGRVVGGVFSEISLVDFPANPRSGFALAKRAQSGELEIVEKTFEAELTKAAPTPAEVFGTVEKAEKGTDAVAEQAEKSADAEVTPVEAEVTKGGRDCKNCGATHHDDSSDKFCANCGTKLPGKAEKAEEADVAKAADANADDGDESDEGKDDDGADEGKDDGDDEDAAASKSVVPLFTRRLHDATCAAFHEEDVLEAHPVVAKGIPSLIDPAPWAEAVTKALTEDAGSGSRMAELPALSEAYGLAVSLKAADAAVLDEAMDGLRKSFADAFPGAHPTPGAVTPGQFKRPYITAGRTALTAKPGQHPRIPLSSHVPDAADFKAADPDLTKRTYYTNAAKEHASSTLTAMHDYIAGQHPGVCPMGTEPLEAAAASEKALDMRADSVPTPITQEAPTDVTKADVPELSKSLDAFRAELTKFAPASDVNALRDELENERGARELLEKRLADLEKAPDPHDRAYRGGPLAALRPKAVESAAGSADAGEVEVLKSTILKARRDPSGPDFDALIKRFGPTEAANLVAD